MEELQSLTDSRGVRGKGLVLHVLFEKMLGCLHFKTYIWPLPIGPLGKQILLLIASKVSFKK